MIENNLIYGSIAASLWCIIAVFHYLIYANFRDHAEISSRTLFLSEGTPKAFKVLAVVTTLYIIGTVFRIGVMAAAPNLENLASVFYRSGSILISAGTIYWQYKLYRFTLKPSNR